MLRACIIATAIALAACTPRVESDPDKLVNHFKFWMVDEIPYTDTVTLSNQFDDKENRPPRNEKLNGLFYIGNPVVKNETGIVNDRHHLLAYFIDPPNEDRRLYWVDISNQITNDEKERWRLGLSSLLLAPASKVLGNAEPPDWPRTLDHYECHTVRDAKEIQVNLTLTDQFDRERGAPELITTVTPAFFCLPVEKNDHAMVKPLIHLALYDIKPPTKLGPDFPPVRARDQFDRRTLVPTQSVFLGVPTRKLDFGFDQ